MSAVSGGCVALGPNIIACSPSTFTWRTVRRCNACRTRRRHIVQDAYWYGRVTTCLACGLRRDYDEWRPRRVGKRTRIKQRDMARRLWADGSGTRAEYLAWLREQSDAYRGAA